MNILPAMKCSYKPKCSFTGNVVLRSVLIANDSLVEALRVDIAHLFRRWLHHIAKMFKCKTSHTLLFLIVVFPETCYIKHNLLLEKNCVAFYCWNLDVCDMHQFALWSVTHFQETWVSKLDLCQLPQVSQWWQNVFCNVVFGLKPRHCSVHVIYSLYYTTPSLSKAVQAFDIKI